MKTNEIVEKLFGIYEINNIDEIKTAILQLIKELNAGIAAQGRSTAELLTIRELDDREVSITINLFNSKNWKFIDLVMQNKRARVLKKIYEDRIALLKKHFRVVSFSVDEKGFILNKTENQDWKEKLESYIKADKEFCNRIDIEKELKNSGWDSGKGRGGFRR